MVNTYKSYSRLAKVEEQKNKRSAIFFIVLTIGFIIFLAFFGIGILGNIVRFVGERNENETQNSDTIAPAPPLVSSLPEFVNTDSIKITGSSEEDSLVVISVNNKKTEVETKEGEFEFEAKLNKGENEIFAIAIDVAGNESSDSKEQIVIYDNEKPKVEITKPKDGEKFYGTTQKQISFEGKTESEVKITLNDRLVSVDSSGGFKYPLTLGDGENSLNLKVTDRAGNQTEITIVVNYSP